MEITTSSFTCQSMKQYHKISAELVLILEVVCVCVCFACILRTERKTLISINAFKNECDVIVSVK